MKRNNIILVMMLVITGVFTIQSCTKDEGTKPKVYLAAVPSTPDPVDAAIVPFTGTPITVNLKWAGTATNAIAWDVYFGTSSKPSKVASNVTSNAYSVDVTVGGTYYWQVVTIDANNVKSTSPVWSLEVNSNPNIPTLTDPHKDSLNVSCTPTLAWSATDPENDDLTYDVYLDTASTPKMFAAGLTDSQFAITKANILLQSKTYYWKVVTKDPYGGSSESPVQKFTTGIILPDFSVFSGLSTESAPSITSKTATVSVSVNTGTNTISLFVPLADAMVNAGWGISYSGPHGVSLTYDPVTLKITGEKQLSEDSFIDPKEMGPMYLTATGTIDPDKKVISVMWTISGNDYWGTDAVLPKATTYTMK